MQIPEVLTYHDNYVHVVNDTKPSCRVSKKMVFTKILLL